MFKSLYNATSGMDASQKSLSTISNNISNAQTTAFKKQRTEFAELFYQQLKSPTAPGERYAGTNPIDIGNGVSVAGVTSDFTQGSLTSTGVKTDLSIQGDGFFIVGDIEGRNRVYTRSGNFDLSQNYELITKSGQYVLGWNADALTGKINTGAGLEPIKLPLGEISEPSETTNTQLTGNLDSSAETGTMYGVQMLTYDRKGNQHDVDMNFIKLSGNNYRYVAIPTDQFRPSASIENAVMRTSDQIASLIQKGDYQIQTTPAAGSTVDITVLHPDGTTVLTQNVADVGQTITLMDGAGRSWFTIDYTGGGAPSNASFTVGEVGDISFDSVGKMSSLTGSAMAGTQPLITYTPIETGQPVNIEISMETLTSLAADSSVRREPTDGDGNGAAALVNYTITDGGKVEGYYSDGTIRPVGQVSMATFSNVGGLTRMGNGDYLPSPNSGLAEVGTPSTGSRGQIKAQALESSNVDIAKEFVDMLSVQKMFQANTKVIRTSEEFLNDIINLIR